MLMLEATTQPTAWFATGHRVLSEVRVHWVSLLAWSLLGGLIAAVTAFLVPSYYRSGAAFQAETTQPFQLSGALAGLASQLSSGQLGSQNSSQFFADLLTTNAVLRRVSHASYPWRGGTATLATIYDLDSQPPALREYSTLRKLQKAFVVDVSLRTGVVRFTVEARTPELALALAESTLVALNEANIALRQTRAAAERQFTSSRADAARQELEASERDLAAFYQSNRVISNSPALQMTEAKLKRAVDMAQQVYVQLRLQEEQAAVQEVRNTPAISVIDPPVIPVKRSWPHRKVAVFLGLLAGALIAAIKIIVEDQRKLETKAA